VVMRNNQTATDLILASARLVTAGGKTMRPRRQFSSRRDCRSRTKDSAPHSFVSLQVLLNALS
jgi:hypothetical protein